MKQSALAAVLALLVVVAVAVLPAATVADTATPAATVADTATPAGYTHQEDVTGYFIKQVGTFAVTVYKLTHMVRMYYVSTSQCWSMPAGGGANNYWMVLTATNGTGAAGSYVATVWGIPVYIWFVLLKPGVTLLFFFLLWHLLLVEAR